MNRKVHNIVTAPGKKKILAIFGSPSGTLYPGYPRPGGAIDNSPLF